VAIVDGVDVVDEAGAAVTATLLGWYRTQPRGNA
jgi:hypothetical protein